MFQKFQSNNCFVFVVITYQKNNNNYSHEKNEVVSTTFYVLMTVNN